MVVCEVLLHHLEELLIGLADELRPALAGGDPPLPFFDRWRNAQIVRWCCIYLWCAPPSGGVPV